MASPNTGNTTAGTNSLAVLADVTYHRNSNVHDSPGITMPGIFSGLRSRVRFPRSPYQIPPETVGQPGRLALTCCRSRW
ncbi:hypothetical protein VTN77DRAFT_9366 [Rasamsonia byssochlamydoides]|uniref:uncharacterized protein n=1 Tax=Rasamsonia byssochlamydoides TaxID=89139 RepID=UPI003743CC0F